MVLRVAKRVILIIKKSALLGALFSFYVGVLFDAKYRNLLTGGSENRKVEYRPIGQNSCRRD